MIEKKKIEQLPVLPAKAKRTDQYIGRIRMHKDTIVMDVYDTGDVMSPDEVEVAAEIEYRWVCDGKNFYTYRFRTQRWISGGLHYAVHGTNLYLDHLPIRLDESGEQIAKEFLENWKCKISPYYYTKNQADRLMGLETGIIDGRRESREQRRWDRIEARRKKREALPKDWEKWLASNVYKEERYIFYQTKKSGIGRCAHCGEIVRLDLTAKHNARGRCTACGSRIQYKASGRSKRVEDKKKAVYIQKIDGGFLTRYFCVVKISTPAGESYQTNEVALDTRIGERMWRDYCKISGMTGEEFWDDRRTVKLNNWTPEGYLYTRNVRNVLRGTDFKYAPLVEWMKHERGSLPIGDFLVEYQSKPYLEYFIKAGLYRLTKETVIHPYARIFQGRNMKEILGINRQRTERLIKMDGGIRALEWLRYEEAHDCKISDEMIGWFQDEGISIRECEGILPVAGSFVRMENYLKKQEGTRLAALIRWRDYLRIAQDEGMDITDDIVRFPKDLSLRHDQLVERCNLRRQEEQEKERQEHFADLNRKINEWLAEAERYSWANKDYVITPAVKCEELEEEGRVLHHCVGRNDHYMKKMAAGTSWILFLRKKAEPGIPYYTLEIRMEDDEILQWYSAFDRQPDAQVIKKVLDTFQKGIKKRKRVEIPVRVTA